MNKQLSKVFVALLAMLAFVLAPHASYAGDVSTDVPVALSTAQPTVPPVPDEPDPAQYLPYVPPPAGLPDSSDVTDVVEDGVDVNAHTSTCTMSPNAPGRSSSSNLILYGMTWTCPEPHQTSLTATLFLQYLSGTTWTRIGPKHKETTINMNSSYYATLDCSKYPLLVNKIIKFRTAAQLDLNGPTGTSPGTEKHSGYRSLLCN